MERSGRGSAGATWLDRYTSGETEKVWAEMVAALALAHGWIS